ncbi:MAG: DUF952 domain-containing protein [Thermaurantiacus sp.]
MSHRPEVRIFKIFRKGEWRRFQETGAFTGSTDDLRDGFIHLSTHAQLAGTLARHFAGETELMIAEVLVANDPALRWEVSRGGARFPHLYRPLTLADIGTCEPASGSADAPAS